MLAGNSSSGKAAFSLMGLDIFRLETRNLWTWKFTHENTCLTEKAFFGMHKSGFMANKLFDSESINILIHNTLHDNDYYKKFPNFSSFPVGNLKTGKCSTPLYLTPAPLSITRLIVYFVFSWPICNWSHEALPQWRNENKFNFLWTYSQFSLLHANNWPQMHRHSNLIHCGMRDKSSIFLSAIFKNLIFLCSF